AQHIMIEARVTASKADTLQSVVCKMEQYSISSIFVLGDAEKVLGIVTVDDAVKGAKRKETIEEILKEGIVVDNEEYMNDLIAKSLETKYPLAVVDKAQQI